MIKIYFILVLLVLLSFANSTKADSTSVYNASGVRYFYSNSLLKDSTLFFSADTQLLNYQRFNQSLKNGIGNRANLGGYGLASRNHLFESDSTIGFDYGFHSFDDHLYTIENTKFFDARSPYTSLTFINGRLKQQSLEATFSENINPRFNVGFDFKRNGSTNYYQRQKTNHTNFRFFTTFLSKNSKYRSFATIIVNKIDAQENGGIVNNNIINTGSSVSTEFEPVKLSTATNIQRGLLFSLQHKYSFVNDLKIDSSKTKKSVSVFQNANYSENKYEFKDENNINENYKFQFLNSSITNDSTFISSLNHEFGINYLGFSFSTFQQGVFIKQDTKINNFLNNGFRTQLNLPISNYIKVKGDAYQILSGYNSGDYSVEGGFELNDSIGKKIAEFGFLSSSKSPAFIFNSFNANSSRWENDFKNQTNQSFFGSINFYQLIDQVKLSINTINNVLYFAGADSSVVIPKQFFKSIEIVGIELNKQIRFGKFVSQNNINYQKIANTKILRSPEFSGIHSLYYSNKVFKKAVEFQVGFDLSYFSSFRPYSYQASVNQFITSDNTLAEAYAQIDLFLVAKLKRTRFIVKFDHLNEGWIRPSYITTDGYPMAPRTFVLGIDWKFFD